MNKSDIGINAGIIWHLLSEKGPLTVSELCKSSKLERDELMLASGWLARENKIEFFPHEKDLMVSLSCCQFYF